MNKLIGCAALLGSLFMAPAASATTVACTVTTGTVLTSFSAGSAYSIGGGNGTSTGGATGVISCPAIATGVGFIDAYQVLAGIGYSGVDDATVDGTSVTQVLTLVGGALNGSFAQAVASGGFFPNTFTPSPPFQIGSTLSGATSYPAFTVNVASQLTSGGPVGAATGAVYVSFQVAQVSAIPEPASVAMMLVSLGVLGSFVTRKPVSA
jgi:hypothetical protein